MNRRNFLRTASFTASAFAGAHFVAANTRAAAAPGPAVTKGRINQSIAQWCFELFGEKWSIDQTCQVAKQLGCKSVELIGPELFPTLKKHGLTCAIAQINMNPDPPFLRGSTIPTIGRG